ncbi:hypothetical protein VA596_37315 [Amycolatopsis sp., V23-08]|uniref:Uncharacterized protein n=1 Tax=Amycolatopsis heterodermiae TaxID=3110235 RepID=A0ABU5RI13_9PSEU|nr:hypothetical protein [Amycolatopsis sp., V23-08]MEA5365239.1 hypothetical protein [Amycolatopsis sp., V23-08]
MAWQREDPDAGVSSREAIPVEPVEGDGPPTDTEPGEGVADAGPERAALHVEDER